jgi:hypothetical protein
MIPKSEKRFSDQIMPQTNGMIPKSGSGFRTRSCPQTNGVIGNGIIWW